MHYLNKFIAGKIPDDEIVLQPNSDSYFQVKEAIIKGYNIVLLEWYERQQILSVYYKNNLFLRISDLLDFHQIKYKGIRFIQESEISSNKFSYHHYFDNNLIKFSISSYTINNKHKSQLLFDGEYNLVEYSELYYDKDEILTNIKHFYPKNWVIHDDN